MPYPVDYLKAREGLPFSAFDVPLANQAEVQKWLEKQGLVATRICDPFGGQVARVQIDVYGESAAEVEATLLEYAGRCDAASQATSVSYGRCVIERNLEEQWGDTYSWRGRLVLHPEIGTIPSSERAKVAVAERDENR